MRRIFINYYKSILKIINIFIYIYIIINKRYNYEIYYEQKITKEIINLKNYYQTCNKGILLNKKKFKKNNHPKVSVVSAVFNSEKTILRLIRSIQNQFFDNIEIIFIDDKSNDNTISIIRDCQKEDQRIILIKNKVKLGTLLSRNIGILKSSGEYIIIPDSDDMLSENILKICYRTALKNNYEMIRYNVYENDDKNFIKLVKKLKKKPIYQPELSTYIFYGFGYLCLHEFTLWNKFIKREAYIRALNSINPYYLNQYMIIFEDGLINYALYRSINSFYLINNIGYYYIFNKDTSVQHSSMIKYDLPKYIFLYIKFILDNSKNTKYEKDMALHIYHLYNYHASLVYLVKENFYLYKYVINFFLNYKFITLEDKNKFEKLKKIIIEKEKNITKKYI